MTLKSLVLMECSSACMVNCNGAAQIRYYFYGTDELDFGCNKQSLKLLLKKKGMVMEEGIKCQEMQN